MNMFANGASSALLEASKGPMGSVFDALGTVPEGLTEPEVQERLQTYGRNTVAHERATAWPLMLLNKGSLHQPVRPDRGSDAGREV
jgi:hypothetical protein